MRKIFIPIVLSIILVLVLVNLSSVNAFYVEKQEETQQNSKSVNQVLSSSNNYFPGDLGLSWKYRWWNDVYEPDVIIEYISVSEVNGTISHYNVDYSSHPDFHHAVFSYSIETDRIWPWGYRTLGGSNFHPTPHYVAFHFMHHGSRPLLRYPVSVGDTWTGETVMDGKFLWGDTEVTGFESVTLSTGLVTALRTTTVISYTGNNIISGTKDMWFVNNTGLVKLVYEHADGSTTYVEYDPCRSLDIAVNPILSGTVSVNPSPNCGPGNYLPGTEVVITATPDIDFSFWSGDASGAANPKSIIMDVDKSVVANFGIVPAPILLVDDDDDLPNVISKYISTLEALGKSYDVWDTMGSRKEPDLEFLSMYPTVIWFSGDAYALTGHPSERVAGPGVDGEIALGSWLESDQRCLLISSQDYVYDAGGLSSFMETFLGVYTVTEDVGQSVVTGTGSVFGGLGSFPLFYSGFEGDYSDQVTIDSLSEYAFNGSSGGGAGVMKDTGTYKTAFFAFPFETIEWHNDPKDIMSAFLNWCEYWPRIYFPMILR